jgi:hypothetical protein
VLLAADPDAATHQAFGVPAFDFVEGEMPSPRNGFEANPVLNEKDRFQPSEVNQQIVAAQSGGTYRLQRQVASRRGDPERR